MHWWSVNNRQRHDGSLPRSWPSLNPTWPPLHRGSFASYALARYDKYCTRYKLRRVLHFTSNKKWFPWPHVNVIFNWHNKNKHKAPNSIVKFGHSSHFVYNLMEIFFDANKVKYICWSCNAIGLHWCPVWTSGTSGDDKELVGREGRQREVDFSPIYLRTICFSKIHVGSALSNLRHSDGSPIWGQLASPHNVTSGRSKIHVETTLLTLGLTVCGLTVVGCCPY